MLFSWTEPYVIQLYLHKLSYTKLWVLFALSQTLTEMFTTSYFLYIYIYLICTTNKWLTKTIDKMKLTDNILNSVFVIFAYFCFLTRCFGKFCANKMEMSNKSLLVLGKKYLLWNMHILNYENISLLSTVHICQLL